MESRGKRFGDIFCSPRALVGGSRGGICQCIWGYGILGILLTDGNASSDRIHGTDTYMNG